MRKQAPQTEAKDPNTTPIRLEQLSQTQDKRVIAAVAENPSTPLETLLALAAQYPLEFLQNPVMPLLLLEDPNVLHAISSKGAHVLLKLPESPEWVLHSLASHQDEHVRCFVARNPNTPITLLEVLVRDQHERVRQGVADNPNTPVTLLAALALDASRLVLVGVARNPNTPRDVLDALYQDPNNYKRLRFAAPKQDEEPTERGFSIPASFGLAASCGVAFAAYLLLKALLS